MSNLRTLMSAPGRFEHHLIVVARAGGAVLECTTASEPLAFAHANVSDEYALMLPIGNPLADAFQARTFITDAAGHDVAKLKHGVGDLVLHPHGFLHWPGRLRPPYTPFKAPLRGLSLVFCAARPTLPGNRALDIVDTKTAAPGLVGVVADARLELVHDARDLRHDGWLVDLETCELHRLPADLPGVRRGLLFYAPHAPAADPPLIPEPPFPPFEAGPPGTLPFARDGLTARAISDAVVEIAIDGARAEIPRHWLARMLFRIGLHGFRLGRVETYGGLWADDQAMTMGLPEKQVAMTRELLAGLYRAVAPPGYSER